MSEDDELSPVDGEEVRYFDLPQIVAGLREALAECGLPLADGDLAQRKNIPTLVAAISDAGLDGEAFVRYGCTDDLAWPMAIALALDTLLVGPTANGQLWVESLEISTTLAASARHGDIGAIPEVANALIPTVRRWVHNAPFSDIVTLTPPSSEIQRVIFESPEVADELSEDYRWIADRLGGHDLDHWSASSLTHEYRWLRGADSHARLPAAVLEHRPFTPADVAQELADRHLLSGQFMTSSPPVVYQVEQQAKQFLHAGRFSDAATLFEFMGENKWMPQDLCFNDRGFCLLPKEPRRALRFLQRAATMGYRFKTVNTYNQMCCMLALDDVSGLRNAAEHYWLEEFEPEPQGATLWARDGDRWVLKKTPDARECIAKLALEVAEREAWTDRVERWEMRLAALRNGEHQR